MLGPALSLCHLPKCQVDGNQYQRLAAAHRYSQEAEGGLQTCVTLASKCLTKMAEQSVTGFKVEEE